MGSLIATCTTNVQLPGTLKLWADRGTLVHDVFDLCISTTNWIWARNALTAQEGWSNTEIIYGLRAVKAACSVFGGLVNLSIMITASKATRVVVSLVSSTILFGTSFLNKPIKMTHGWSSTSDYTLSASELQILAMRNVLIKRF